jgi:hypothetical protein
VRRSIDASDALAALTGSRVVHPCGFDSVPSDLAVLLLHEEAGELNGTTLVVKSTRGGVSGGTLESVRGHLDEHAATPPPAGSSWPRTRCHPTAMQSPTSACSGTPCCRHTQPRAGLDRTVADGTDQHRCRPAQQSADRLGVRPLPPRSRSHGRWLDVRRLVVAASFTTGPAALVGAGVSPDPGAAEPGAA